MSDRKGDWMTTYTGKQFWPLDPRSSEVCIEDIAHALSLICRFGGHCKEFYSVAQHSCLVADIVGLVEPKLVMYGLLHDAAEAYIGDVVRPMKRSIVGYDEIEAGVMAAVVQHFRIGLVPGIIKWCDDVALRNEHRCLINDGKVWDVDNIGGPDIDMRPCWTPAKAEAAFMRKFELYQT